jgi:hypothetical protein
MTWLEPDPRARLGSAIVSRLFGIDRNQEGMLMAQARGRYTTDPGPRFDRCKEEATRLLAGAADAWAAGDPADPDPAEVLEKLLDVFARERFLRRPYGSGA